MSAAGACGLIRAITCWQGGQNANVAVVAWCRCRRFHPLLACGCSQICGQDILCSSCASPWHVKHLERQSVGAKTPAVIPKRRGTSESWHCPRCTHTCCCQTECTLETTADGHRCCHLRRKQLKERRCVAVCGAVWWHSLALPHPAHCIVTGADPRIAASWTSAPCHTPHARAPPRVCLYLC